MQGHWEAREACPPGEDSFGILPDGELSLRTASVDSLF